MAQYFHHSLNSVVSGIYLMLRTLSCLLFICLDSRLNKHKTVNLWYEFSKGPLWPLAIVYAIGMHTKLIYISVTVTRCRIKIHEIDWWDENNVSKNCISTAKYLSISLNNIRQDRISLCKLWFYIHCALCTFYVLILALINHFVRLSTRHSLDRFGMWNDT